MARSLLRDRDPAVPTLVVAGGLHTSLDTDEPNLANLIDREIPGVPNGVLDYPTASREGLFSRDRTGCFVFALPNETPS
jgi:hypothetical protein